MKILILFLATSFTIPSFALDEHSQKALDETQQLLRDKKQREKAAGENDQTKKADSYIDEIGANKDATYDLSADIFAELVKRANGDPAVMQKLLEEASRDPAAFANSLSADQKAKIKGIAAPMAAPVSNH